jgi:nucleotide-binding universal stress UspA family protein
MPFKVIVVGTDGSERSAGAVSEALALATMAGSTLHAVHVVHPAVEAGHVESKAWQLAIDEERGEVEHSKAQLATKAEHQGVSVEYHTPGGSDVADALLNTAEAVNADLIVVGNRGMSGVTRFVLGSIPNKVAHRCHCSVLIVDTDAT